MGGGNSKQAQLERYGHLLSRIERQVLESTFHEIAGSQDATTITEKQLTGFLTTRLYPANTSDTVRRGIFLAFGGGEGDVISFQDFIECSSHLLRGSATHRSQHLMLLSSGQVNILQDTLHTLVNCICISPPPYNFPSPWLQSTPQSIASLVKFLFKHLIKEQDVGVVSERRLSADDIESWLGTSLASTMILDVAFSTCLYHQTLTSSNIPIEISSLVGLPVKNESVEGERDSGWDTQRTLIPLCIYPPTGHHGNITTSNLLSTASLIMINSYLPVEVRGQMYPIFLSNVNGQSFSTLCKSLVDSGPSLLVIRDTEGHVFGGFASVSWQYGPQFIGNSECFLFSLSPEMAIYTATGYNNHYMYLQHTAQTMPNGLGMGGQLEYCGLWLSSEFDKGHSKGRPQCTTFGSPSLSGSEEFNVDVVEVWHIGPPPEPNDQETAGGSSILDKDKVAGHILEMAGKTRHSDGLREPPPETD